MTKALATESKKDSTRESFSCKQIRRADWQIFNERKDPVTVPILQPVRAEMPGGARMDAD
jgi:hypothetical protein